MSFFEYAVSRFAGVDQNFKHSVTQEGASYLSVGDKSYRCIVWLVVDAPPAVYVFWSQKVTVNPEVVLRSQPIPVGFSANMRWFDVNISSDSVTSGERLPNKGVAKLLSSKYQVPIIGYDQTPRR
eukprot:3380177-Pyramimonas_sp.AAC.2